MIRPILAVIPARGGSKGLPGKNIRPLVGQPLIWHSHACAAMTPLIDRCIISTDDAAIAEVARSFGADVPFLRPSGLSADDSPMMPVLRHALDAIEGVENRPYGSVLLLDPTSPCRLPQDISKAVELLESMQDAVGAIAVSEPRFNPLWVGVTQSEDRLRRAFPAQPYARRQDVPAFLRINGALYLWRAEFVRRAPDAWFDAGPHLGLVMPESRAFSIDDIDEFQQLEALIMSGFVQLPWLGERDSRDHA
jgi:CMP-N,N'-diacetyllegionaminic acid synthase